MKMRRAPEDRGVSMHTSDNSEFDEMDRADLVENIKMKYAKNKSTDPGDGRLGSPKALEKHDNLFGKDGTAELPARRVSEGAGAYRLPWRDQ